MGFSDSQNNIISSIDDFKSAIDVKFFLLLKGFAGSISNILQYFSLVTAYQSTNIF